jgi:peptidyl-prolyl cis-trans isomerase D
MLDFFRDHAKKFQWVLFPLLLLGLGFVGIQGFSGFWDASNATVAKVDGIAITQAEWDQAHQRQVERARQAQPDLDVKQLDTPEAKAQVLDQLVRERVILAAVNKQHLSIGDQRLVREMMASPDLASLKAADGSLDREKYKQVLASQGMTPEMYEASLRQQLAMRSVLDGVAESTLAPAATVSAALDALLQRREVSLVRFPAQDYMAKVNPSDADIEAYHKAHPDEFRTPEQATIELVVLDMDALKAGVTVSADELKTYYDQNAARFTVAEERRARHVLVKADKDAAADVKAKAKAKAEGLLVELRKNPASFADVARKNSDDPGSAARGGDLDFFARGAMVKAFEDAAFAMKPGEISNVVESEFGYHIIQLDQVRGGAKKSFDEVRPEIEDELRKQQAAKRWAEAAEQFTNMVYEQPDSLQPVIDKFKLLKQSAIVRRQPAADAKGALASAKLLDAVFANDVVQNKRNTAAVDVAPNQLASARVVQHQSARVQALSEVRDAVKARVQARQAADLARKEGALRLEQMRKDPTAAVPGLEKVTFSRLGAQGLPRKSVETILAADAVKLPAFVGVDMGAIGYMAVRIDKVLPRDTAGDEGKGMDAQYKRTWAGAETLAYLEALKTRFKAEVRVKAPATAASAAAR